MDYEFYNRLIDRSAIRPVAPVFKAYLPETNFQPQQGTSENLYVDIHRLHDPQWWGQFEFAPLSEQQQRTMQQLETLISGGTLNESLVTAAKDPTISLAWRSAFSGGGPLEIMKAPPQNVTKERSDALDAQIKELVANTPESELTPDSESPQAKLLKKKLEEKAYIDARLAGGKKDLTLAYFPYMRSTGTMGNLWADIAEPVWNAWVWTNGNLGFWDMPYLYSDSKNKELPTFEAGKIIGTDIYDSLTAVDPDFNPKEFFDNVLAKDPVVRGGLLSYGVNASTILNAKNEFAARVMVGMQVNSTNFQKRLATYNPTWFEEIVSLGKNLGNTVVNNPDTPVLGTVELGAAAIALALTAVAPPAGAAALGALALGGSGKAVQTYRAWKTLRAVRATASTVWSLGAGGIPTWGRSWGIVRSMLWNGAIAAGTNTSLNYFSQVNNIATANGLHYMHPDMSPNLNSEELVESSIYGFLFGAGLSLLGSSLSTVAGKAAGSKTTPLDVSFKNARKLFKGTTRAQDVNPIARLTVQAETKGNTPSIEAANAAVRNQSESVEAASSVGSRTADSSPDNPLMRKFDGEDMATFVQRTASNGSMDSPKVVLDAMSNGRRFDTLDPDEQHQIALESVPVVQAIIKAELASPDITKERKAQLAEIEKDLYKEVKKSGKNLTQQERETIKERVAKGEAYKRMGIQTPNALDNAEQAKQKASGNAKEILDRATGKEPVRNPDTSPEGAKAEKTADELAAELEKELETIPDRVLNEPATKQKILRRITKVLLGGTPEVTLRRLAIAKAKGSKLSKQQRRNQISVLQRRDMFLSLAVGNREAVNRFYMRIQGLVDMGYITEDAQRIILALTVNLNFNRKPMQTEIRIGKETGYVISDNEIRIGDLTLVSEDAAARQAFIVLHEIGHAYEMFGTGASIMKLRKLFGNMDDLAVVAKELLESDPYNINYTIGNTQELYATGFARMLMNDLRYTLMMESIKQNRGLLAYLLQEMITDIGAALINAAESLKLSKAANESELFNIIRETMEHIENNSKPVLRRLDAINRIAAGVDRVKQSYEKYLETAKATTKLSFTEWLHKKANSQEIANRINRSLVEGIPEIDREQVLKNFGVTRAEALLIIQGQINNTFSIDAVINAKMDGRRLDFDSTSLEVHQFIQAVADNHAVNRRYFVNIYKNYLTALQVNGLNMPKKPLDTSGPINTQIADLEEYVNGLTDSDLEVQQPYLDPTLGVLSDDINLAMHYLAGQEGLNTSLYPLVDILGNPREVLFTSNTRKINKKFTKSGNRWTPVVNALNKLLDKPVEVIVYSDNIRAFYRRSDNTIHLSQSSLNVRDSFLNNTYPHELLHAVTVRKLEDYMLRVQNEQVWKVIRSEGEVKTSILPTLDTLSGTEYLKGIKAWADNPNVDPAVRELFDTYLEAAKADPLVHMEKTTSSPSSGVYFTQRKLITAWDLLNRYANANGKGDKLVEEGGRYGFGNIWEFLAEGISDSQMQNLLISLPSKNRGMSIFTRLVNALKKFLWIPPELGNDTLFIDLIRLTEELATTPQDQLSGTRRAYADPTLATTPPEPPVVLLGAPKERPRIPTNTNEAIVKVGELNAALIRNPKTTKQAMLKTVKENFGLSEGAMKLLEDAKTPKEVLTHLAAGLKSGLYESSPQGTKVSVSVIETELTPAQLNTAAKMVETTERPVTVPIPDRNVIWNAITELDQAASREVSAGTQIDRKVRASMDDLQSAIAANDMNAVALALFNLQTRLAKMNETREPIVAGGVITRWWKFPETMQTMDKAVAAVKEVLDRSGYSIETPTGKTWSVDMKDVRIAQWIPPQVGEDIPVITQTIKPVIKKNGVTVVRGEVAVQDVRRRHPLIPNKFVSLSQELDAAIASTARQDLINALAEVPIPNRIIEAAKADNPTVQTAALISAGRETLVSLPEEAPRKPTEPEVRQQVIKSAKEQSIAAQLLDATDTVDNPNVVKVATVSEPVNAIEPATAVVSDSVNAATPHLPIGVAEEVVASGTTERMVSTAPTKPLKVINISSEKFSNTRLGMIGDLFYSSLADMEAILLSLPTDIANAGFMTPDIVAQKLRRLYKAGKEQEAIELFTVYMTDTNLGLGLEGVVVRDPKKPTVAVRKYMFNKKKWAYGGITVHQPQSPKAKATTAIAPDGKPVPVNAPEAETPVAKEGGRDTVSVTDEDRLAIVLNESRDGLRDSGMDTSDFRLLLKKFWRVLKDKSIKRARKIPEEFKDLMYKISEINAGIMEINRQQLRDDKIAQKFWEVVDRLVAAEEGKEVSIPNYRRRSITDIYNEAAKEVSSPNIRFIPPLHAGQIKFKMGRVEGKNVIRISYNVDKETLNLIKLIREDTSKLAPTTAPLAVRVAQKQVPEKPVVAPDPAAPNLPNAPNTRSGPAETPTVPDVPERERFTRRGAMQNIVNVIMENPAMLLRLNNLVGILFGGSERSTRSWWRSFMGSTKNFTQSMSSMGHTIRSKVDKMRTLAFFYDDTHAVQSTLLGPNKRPLKTVLQCHIDAHTAVLGIYSAYGKLKEEVRRLNLNPAQQDALLKYYLMSRLNKAPINEADLKALLKMENLGTLTAALNKLHLEESRFNQINLNLRRETEWNPVLDAEGNPVDGDSYTSITFDPRKWRKLEEGEQDIQMLQRLVAARTDHKLKQERLDINTLIVMGILNIDNVDNIFFGERNFTVTTNPNLTRETLNKLKDPDRGYRVMRKSAMTKAMQDDVYAARKDEARKYFIVETGDRIEIFPVPETLADLGETDLRRYQDAIKGDTNMYTPEWRKWLNGKDLISREMKELINYKLYRGEYMMRNIEGIKSGGRPVLNAKDEFRLRIQNLTTEEIQANPDLLDVVDLHRQRVAMNLAKHSLFDLMVQKELDKMSGFKGYRIWQFLEDMERSMYEETDRRTDLSAAQKDAWKESIKLGITRLMWQHADWNGTVPHIRTSGDRVLRGLRALVSVRGVSWGMSGLPENMREIILKAPRNPGTAIPVGIWHILRSLFKFWDRGNSAQRWDLMDMSYAVEDMQLNNAKFDEQLQIGELDADELGYGSIWRNWKETKGAGKGERTVKGMEAMGQTAVLFGGSRELMDMARSYSKARHLRYVYDLINKTNIDRFIELLKDPENTRIMRAYIQAAQTSAVDERRAAKLFKALARQAGLSQSDAMLLESFGLMQPENLQAIRWAINKLGTQDGQVNFNELMELYWTLRSSDAPEIDPEVFKNAILKYRVGLENAIRRTSVHHSYGLNKAMGPMLSTTEMGKLMVQLTSWLRGWEDGFSASLAIMGGLKAVVSVALLAAVLEFIKDRITEWAMGRDVEDMVAEYSENPEEVIATIATRMPVAGYYQPVVENGIRSAIILSGGAVKQHGGMMSELSDKLGSSGPAMNSAIAVLRDAGKGSVRAVEGIRDGNMGEVVGGVMEATQVSHLMNRSQYATPVRTFEELANLERKHAVQILLDSFQKKERPYLDKGRRATTPQTVAPMAQPVSRNRVLEDAMLRSKERPAIPQYKPTPQDKTSGVSSLLGSLLEGYRGTP